MSVTSVERAFALLRAVPGCDGTLSGLARETGLPLATVSRLMGTLEQAGAVLRTDKEYRIGPTVAELAAHEPAPYDLTALAVGHLNRLATLSNETAGLAESVDTDLVHLHQVATEHDVAVRDWTGFRVAAHSGAIGLAMMAWWPKEQIDAYLETELEQFVTATVTSPAKIRKRLAHTRKHGAIWTTDEYAQGVTTVAAPIRNRDGRAVAALHVHGPSFRFPADGDQRDEVERAVIASGSAINATLGWSST